MAGWFLKGVALGVKTTKYPRRAEQAPGVSPGLPRPTRFLDAAQAQEVASRCPTGALSASGSEVAVDARKCIHCYRCLRSDGAAMSWSDDYDWADVPESATGQGRPLGFEPRFRRSVNILVVDAGDCGACLNEIAQLAAPQYNLHRLGFFLTPTPRHADLLMVVGPVTDAMRYPLLAAYEAMPEPKRVMAVGTCALGGSVFGPSFIAGGGVAELLPVDVEVPGNPPPPLAILHALRVVSGQIRGARR